MFDWNKPKQDPFAHNFTPDLGPLTEAPTLRPPDLGGVVERIDSALKAKSSQELYRAYREADACGCGGYGWSEFSSLPRSRQEELSRGGGRVADQHIAILIVEFALVCLAIAAFSITVTSSPLFGPVRIAFHRVFGSEMLSTLITCPYCFSHWVALAVILTFALPAMTLALLHNVALSWFAIVGGSAVAIKSIK